MPVPRITKEDLKQRLDTTDAALKPVIIDVRLRYPYEHSSLRLPGAVRVLPDGDYPATLPRDRDIVVYDSDPGELVSSQVAADLIRNGYRALALAGGIADWMGANFPVEPREPTAAAGASPAKE
jgi:rhodanese-related sulfurtransferase